MSAAKGPQGFEDFYVAQEGHRWPDLRGACAAENQHVELHEGLTKSYFLDEASVVAGRWLQAQPDQRVLDLCAAPGGKSLVVAQELFGLVSLDEPAQTGEFVANERSADRRGRLKRVLAEHLPEAIQSRIKVTGHDAARWGVHEPGRYDRILLDAPCSSERHLIQNPRYLTDWSAGRSSRLAQQAYAMALSAGQALSLGGWMVYCTCAIANGENDLVIARVLERCRAKRSTQGWELQLALPDPVASPELVPVWAEPTEFGYRILPDRAGGRGPLYLSRLVKCAPS